MVSGKKIYGTIRANTAEFEDLPEPGVPFEYKDLDMSWAIFQRCALNEWFEQVGRSDDEHGTGRVAVWETKDLLWDRLEDYRKSQQKQFADWDLYKVL